MWLLSLKISYCTNIMPFLPQLSIYYELWHNFFSLGYNSKTSRFLFPSLQFHEEKIHSYCGSQQSSHTIFFSSLLSQGLSPFLLNEALTAALWYIPVTNIMNCFLRICGCCPLAKSCPALFGPVDGSTPGSPVLQISPSLHKFILFESMMLSNHLIFCLLFLPSIFPSIRVFSDELVL